MNTSNNTKLAAKEAAGINIHLYSDDHPETTVKGTGFKNAETALRTIELVQQKPRNRQVWTINAMYYRAKHHPHQTTKMRDAMKIYEKWLEEYNQERKESSKTKKGNKLSTTDNSKHVIKKRERKTDITDNEICEDGDGFITTKTKKPCLFSSLSSPCTAPFHRSRSRGELELDYKTMFNVTLPNIGRTEKWPIHLNHCLMRVALDAYWQCCWYDKLDQKKGAMKSMTIPQIENVILIGERMASEGKAYVIRLNEESLAYRGKQRSGGTGHSVEKRKEKQDAKTHLQHEQSPNVAAADENVPDPVHSSLITGEVTSNCISNLTNTNSARNGDNSGRSNKEHNSSKVLNEDALLQVQCATTGRATCRGCKEKIGKGEYRVGMKVWSSGRVITVWHHPICFVGDDVGDGDNASCSAVRVEKVTKGTSARCKYTGSSFVKDDLRLVVEVGSTKNYYHALDTIGPFLTPVYDALRATHITPIIGKGDKRFSSDTSIKQLSALHKTSMARGGNIRGIGQLNGDDREAILAALCQETQR